MKHITNNIFLLLLQGHLTVYVLPVWGLCFFSLSHLIPALCPVVFGHLHTTAQLLSFLDVFDFLYITLGLAHPFFLLVEPLRRPPQCYYLLNMYSFLDRLYPLDAPNFCLPLIVIIFSNVNNYSTGTSE